MANTRSPSYDPMMERARAECIAMYKNGGNERRMEYAVERYIKDSVGTHADRETDILHRLSAIHALAFTCITALNREELQDLDKRLKHIANNPPAQQEVQQVRRRCGGWSR